MTNSIYYSSFDSIPGVVRLLKLLQDGDLASHLQLHFSHHPQATSTSSGTTSTNTTTPHQLSEATTPTSDRTSTSLDHDKISSIDKNPNANNTTTRAFAKPHTKYNQHDHSTALQPRTPSVSHPPRPTPAATQSRAHNTHVHTAPSPTQKPSHRRTRSQFVHHSTTQPRMTAPKSSCPEAATSPQFNQFLYSCDWYDDDTELARAKRAQHVRGQSHQSRKARSRSIDISRGTSITKPHTCTYDVNQKKAVDAERRVDSRKPHAAARASSHVQGSVSSTSNTHTPDGLKHGAQLLPARASDLDSICSGQGAGLMQRGSGMQRKGTDVSGATAYITPDGSVMSAVSDQLSEVGKSNQTVLNTDPSSICFKQAAIGLVSAINNDGSRVCQSSQPVHPSGERSTDDSAHTVALTRSNISRQNSRSKPQAKSDTPPSDVASCATTSVMLTDSVTTVPQNTCVAELDAGAPRTVPPGAQDDQDHTVLEHTACDTEPELEQPSSDSHLVDSSSDGGQPVVPGGPPHTPELSPTTDPERPARDLHSHAAHREELHSSEPSTAGSKHQPKTSGREHGAQHHTSSPSSKGWWTRWSTHSQQPDSKPYETDDDDGSTDSPMCVIAPAAVTTPRPPHVHVTSTPSDTALLTSRTGQQSDGPSNTGAVVVTPVSKVDTQPGISVARAADSCARVPGLSERVGDHVLVRDPVHVQPISQLMGAGGGYRSNVLSSCSTVHVDPTQCTRIESNVGGRTQFSNESVVDDRGSVLGSSLMVKPKLSSWAESKTERRARSAELAIVPIGSHPNGGVASATSDPKDDQVALSLRLDKNAPMGMHDPGARGLSQQESGRHLEYPTANDATPQYQKHTASSPDTPTQGAPHTLVNQMLQAQGPTTADAPPLPAALSDPHTAEQVMTLLTQKLVEQVIVQLYQGQVLKHSDSGVYVKYPPKSGQTVVPPLEAPLQPALTLRAQSSSLTHCSTLTLHLRPTASFSSGDNDEARDPQYLKELSSLLRAALVRYQKKGQRVAAYAGVVDRIVHALDGQVDIVEQEGEGDGVVVEQRQGRGLGGGQEGGDVEREGGGDGVGGGMGTAMTVQVGGCDGSVGVTETSEGDKEENAGGDGSTEGADVRCKYAGGNSSESGEQLVVESGTQSKASNLASDDSFARGLHAPRGPATHAVVRPRKRAISAAGRTTGSTREVQTATRLAGAVKIDRKSTRGVGPGSGLHMTPVYSTWCSSGRSAGSVQSSAANAILGGNRRESALDQRIMMEVFKQELHEDKVVDCSGVFGEECRRGESSSGTESFVKLTDTQMGLESRVKSSRGPTTNPVEGGLSARRGVSVKHNRSQSEAVPRSMDVSRVSNVGTMAMMAGHSRNVTYADTDMAQLVLGGHTKQGEEHPVPGPSTHSKQQKKQGAFRRAFGRMISYNTKPSATTGIKTVPKSETVKTDKQGTKPVGQVSSVSSKPSIHSMVDHKKPTAPSGAQPRAPVSARDPHNFTTKPGMAPKLSRPRVSPAIPPVPLKSAAPTKAPNAHQMVVNKQLSSKAPVLKRSQRSASAVEDSSAHARALPTTDPKRKTSGDVTAVAQHAQTSARKSTSSSQSSKPSSKSKPTQPKSSTQHQPPLKKNPKNPVGDDTATLPQQLNSSRGHKHGEESRMEGQGVPGNTPSSTPRAQIARHVKSLSMGMGVDDLKREDVKREGLRRGDVDREGGQRVVSSGKRCSKDNVGLQSLQGTRAVRQGSSGPHRQGQDRPRTTDQSEPQQGSSEPKQGRVGRRQWDVVQRNELSQVSGRKEQLNRTPASKGRAYEGGIGSKTSGEGGGKSEARGGRREGGGGDDVGERQRGTDGQPSEGCVVSGRDKRSGDLAKVDSLDITISSTMDSTPIDSGRVQLSSQLTELLNSQPSLSVSQQMTDRSHVSGQSTSNRHVVQADMQPPKAHPAAVDNIEHTHINPKHTPRKQAALHKLHGRSQSELPPQISSVHTSLQHTILQQPPGNMQHTNIRLQSTPPLLPRLRDQPAPRDSRAIKTGPVPDQQTRFVNAPHAQPPARYQYPAQQPRGMQSKAPNVTVPDSLYTTDALPNRYPGPVPQNDEGGCYQASGLALELQQQQQQQQQTQQQQVKMQVQQANLQAQGAAPAAQAPRPVALLGATDFEKIFDAAGDIIVAGEDEQAGLLQEMLSARGRSGCSADFRAPAAGYPGAPYMDGWVAEQPVGGGYDGQRQMYGGSYGGQEYGGGEGYGKGRWEEGGQYGHGDAWAGNARGYGNASELLQLASPSGPWRRDSYGLGIIHENK